MELRALDIYKLSPKTNCQACGCMSCMTFAVKVADNPIYIDDCPCFSDEAKTEFYNLLAQTSGGTAANAAETVSKTQAAALASVLSQAAIKAANASNSNSTPNATTAPKAPSTPPVTNLRALDIFKLSPKRNCKECGHSTCMAFSVSVAADPATIDDCPYFSDEAKAEFYELLANATTDASSPHSEEYIKDLNALNNTLASCEKLEKEGRFKEALSLLYRQELRNDFTKDIKRKYYDTQFNIEIKAEEPDCAEMTVADLSKLLLIDSFEKKAYTQKITDLQNALQQKKQQAQKDMLKQSVETARMFERYGMSESASDTLIAAITNASDEFAEEKTKMFKMLVDMLLFQYEYEQIYELRDFFKKIARDTNLGYSLRDKVESHKARHQEEYYNHLYEKALYYMQAGNFEKAWGCIADAKALKNTLDIRCAEVNLATLELDYKKSHSLLNKLMLDKNQYGSGQEIDDIIDQLVNQHWEMLDVISAMIKTYILTNNTEAILSNNGYEGFKDAERLNLPTIAARFTNYDIIDALNKKGFDTDTVLYANNFGIAILAAMQLDSDAFSDYICRWAAHSRTESGKDYANAIVDTLDLVYPTGEEIQKLRTSSGLDVKSATKIVAEKVYHQCLVVLACLLNEECYNDVYTKLQQEKASQEAVATQLKAELPLVLQAIDEECASKCDQFYASAEKMKAYLLSGPQSQKSKADSVVSGLEKAIASAVEFAKKNAQTTKDDMEHQVTLQTQNVEKIQKKLDAWNEIDPDDLLLLFEIPAAAICFEAYDESTQTITATLGHRKVNVSMSAVIADAIMQNSPKLTVEEYTDVEFTENRTLVAKHQYIYSVQGETCTVEFIDSANIDGNTPVQDELITILLSK